MLGSVLGSRARLKASESEGRSQGGRRLPGADDPRGSGRPGARLPATSMQISSEDDPGASDAGVTLPFVPDPERTGTPDPADREFFDHLVSEFEDRGREAVEFLESARALLEGYEDPDPVPRRANDAAYNIREALKRLLPPGSGSGKWRKITNEVVNAKRRYAAVRGLAGTDEAGALDALMAALEELEAFKTSEEGQHGRRLRQVLETRTGVAPLEASLKSYLQLLRQVDYDGVHGSPSIEEVRDYFERALSVIRTLFAPFQLRQPELDALARLEDPTPADAERLLTLCATPHHLAYFLRRAVSPKWLRLLDPHLDPPPGGGAWAALYLTERLGSVHGEEISSWLADRYQETGPTDVSAAYIAAAAVDCMPASAGTLLRALREHPRSQWIRAHAIRAAEAMEPESPILDQLAELLLDPGDEITLAGGAARRLIESLATGMTEENADTRISLLCRRLVAASETRYLLFTLLPMGSIEDVPEDEARGTGVLLQGLMKVVARGMQLGMNVERIFGLVDGLPEGLRHRIRSWTLRRSLDVPLNILVSEVTQGIRGREPTGDDVRLVDRIVGEASPSDFSESWAAALGTPPSTEAIGRALSSNDVPREWRRAKYWYPILPESARHAWETVSRLMEPTYPTASREEYLAPMPRAHVGYAGSPMAQQDLEPLEVEEAARRIAGWRPTDDRMTIARELGRTLEAIVVAQPQKWAAQPLETVALLRHPTYIHHYFEGLAKAASALGGIGPQLVETIAFCRTHPWDVVVLGGDDFDYDPTWVPVDDSGVRLIAALAEHEIDLGDRYSEAWSIVLEAARDRGRDSSIVSPRDDPLETAINRACTKALEAAFQLMSADFKRHGEVRGEAFELLEESLRLEGWDGAEHRAIVAPRLPFVLHVARTWVETNEELLFGGTAPDDLGQKTVELALKWGRPNSWLLERHRRAVRKAVRNKVENALAHMLIAMLWELPGYSVDETVGWLASQEEAALLSDSGERIARLLMREPEVGHLNMGRRFWEMAIGAARSVDSLKGFGWWAEVEALSKEDFERLTLATVERTEGTLDWCVEVAERCAREPVTVSGLDVITRLLRGRHEPWDRSRVADVALTALKATSEHAHLTDARVRLRSALTDLGYFEAQDL